MSKLAWWWCVCASSRGSFESLNGTAICRRMLNHFRPGPPPFIPRPEVAIARSPTRAISYICTRAPRLIVSPGCWVLLLNTSVPRDNLAWGALCGEFIHYLVNPICIGVPRKGVIHLGRFWASDVKQNSGFGFVAFGIVARGDPG